MSKNEKMIALRIAEAMALNGAGLEAPKVGPVDSEREEVICTVPENLRGLFHLLMATRTEAAEAMSALQQRAAEMQVVAGVFSTSFCNSVEIPPDVDLWCTNIRDDWQVVRRIDSKKPKPRFAAGFGSPFDPPEESGGVRNNGHSDHRDD